MYAQPSVFLELSPHSSSVRRRFFSMESEGEIPISSPSQSEVSATHTPQVGDEQAYEFPPKGFPYMEASCLFLILSLVSPYFCMVIPR